MRPSRALGLLLAFICLVGYTNCSGFRTGDLAGASVLSHRALFNDGNYQGKNAVPVTIGSCSYPNAPCVTVTICLSGTLTCVDVNNVLVDTGSTGLRLFKSQIPIALPTLVDASGNSIAECQKYAGGSSDWGPLSKVDVILGSERAANVPIQVIDADFGHPVNCPNRDPGNSVGFNGILGVGLLDQDCASCASASANNVYFSCSASSCASTAVASANLIANPIAFMPFDNNGLVLDLPNVPGDRTTALNGTLYLGVGTQANNTLALPTYAADSESHFTANFNGHSYTNAIIDSGSNAIYFPSPSTTTLPSCSNDGSAPGFFCPSTLQTYSATLSSSTGSPSSSITFAVDNAESLVQSGPYLVFTHLGAPLSGSVDLGLPFFYGRKVVVGITGTTSPLGTGPYWAF